MRHCCKANRLRTSLVTQLTFIKLRAMAHKLAQRYLSAHPAQRWHPGSARSGLRTSSKLSSGCWWHSAPSAISVSNNSYSRLDSAQSIMAALVLHLPKQGQRLPALRGQEAAHELQHQEQELDGSRVPVTAVGHARGTQLLSKFREEEGYVWNEVARKMFMVSGEELFRTGKQCRERWLNHLDPSKQRYA